MAIDKIKNTYSDDVRLALLEQSVNNINDTLVRFEKRFDQLDSKIDKLTETTDLKTDKMNGTIFSQFKWTITLIIGLYGTAFATIFGIWFKSYH